MPFKHATEAAPSWDRATIVRQARMITELNHEAAKQVERLREKLQEAKCRISDLERDIEMLKEGS